MKSIGEELLYIGLLCGILIVLLNYLQYVHRMHHHLKTTSI